LAGPTTCAIVVTYNRRALLQECLQALRDQTHPPDEVIVVDNASTDGTAAMVRERFPEMTLEALRENVGGAGGFHRGLGLGHERGHDWLWLMDDDTIPSPGALAALLAGLARAPERPAMLSSQVQWTDGTLHPMNYPHPRWRSPAALVDAASHGLVLIRSNTFVSLLVARETVDRSGLPQAEYFIWGEDTEYTTRALRHSAGYLVPESVVLHKTRTPYTAVEDTSGRFYYHVRNTLLLLRGSGFSPLERLSFAKIYVRSMQRYLARNRWSPQALRLVGRGLVHGLTGPVR
jgi:rhamnopyranosyl-N-acetylglucosaminyl-diphospho-decaprenol beta-1,3/1,4-galactofuranosyltransferase